MPQFDVHRNAGRSRAAVPFLVVIQSRQFDSVATRLVAPLLAVPLAPGLKPPANLPQFIIEGRSVTLDPLQTQFLPRAVLGPALASLADDESAAKIINALDAVLSRAYG